MLIKNSESHYFFLAPAIFFSPYYFFLAPRAEGAKKIVKYVWAAADGHRNRSEPTEAECQSRNNKQCFGQ